ncbi:MAG: hypothetical protein JXA93_11035 [Anaerolineae bacterium]|nr:hypothetical protein [Anaerolineae bacterium]
MSHRQDQDGATWESAIDKQIREDKERGRFDNLPGSVTIEPEKDNRSETAEARRAEAVRLIITRRERAPRSPRMERALKRLIWRYLSPATVRVEGGEDSPLPAGEGQGGEGDAKR